MVKGHSKTSSLIPSRGQEQNHSDPFSHSIPQWVPILRKKYKLRKGVSAEDVYFSVGYICGKLETIIWF